MKILGVDTTRKQAKVFIVDTKEIGNSYFVELNENIKHSEGLFLHIEKVMLDKKMDISDVDGFACVVGPGSFTGIRVGMATIKGFNKVLSKSILSMNTFELLSSCVKSGIILLNSTNTSCYYAKINNSEIVETGNIEKNQIKELAEKNSIYILKDEQNLIDFEYNNYKIIDSLNDLYIRTIIDKLNTMQYGDFVPYYLQLSQAERNLKNE